MMLLIIIIYSEESSASTPPVSVTYHMNIDMPELQNDSYFTIEDLLDGKYSIMDSDIQWPFIGKQFSCIKWKQRDLPDTQTTIKVKYMIIIYITFVCMYEGALYIIQTSNIPIEGLVIYFIF